ncbi:MAG TPA: flagellar hook-basal body protein [Ghiorsea sp.]|nr:flagellar hook-basal body protein [Ghiorsea sp.]HIP06580.1 flagellar hook-basal body protein [Mariprofundaceae bacterium]
MQSGFFVSGVASKMAENRLDNITHNLANVNTTGYKASRSSFESVLSDSVAGASKQQKPSSYLSMGTQYIDTKAGNIKQTGNALDFALVADGYFLVQQTDGSVALTRAGNFTRDNEGNLTTQSGLAILDDSQSPITLPDGKVSGTREGMIYVDNEQVAQLGLVTLINESDLKQKEGTLLLTSDGNTEDAVGKIVVQHGAVEGSNVNAVLAMTEMVATLRSYESTMKVVEQYNQLAGQLSSNVGKIQG